MSESAARGTRARGAAHGPAQTRRSLPPPQLPGDSAPPAADAHDSDVQQSRPDQHLRSGTGSPVPTPPTSISCHFHPAPPGRQNHPSLMTPLCTVLSDPFHCPHSPSISLLPPRSYFSPWLSSSCPVSAPFKVSQKPGQRITSLTEVRGRAGKGCFTQ